MTLAVANKVVPTYNNGSAGNRRSLPELETDAALYGRGYVDKLYMEWLEEMDRRGEIEKRSAENLTLGYVTQDVSFLSSLL